MYSVVDGMYRLAKELGVVFHFNQDVNKIELAADVATSVHTQNAVYEADYVIGGADYQFIETKLLPPTHRTYSNAYWESRLMAPSCLLYYVGINKRLANAPHHMLFFDVPFDQHAKEIYTTKEWPGNPSFYVSASSVTDPTVAPSGCEALVFLIPVAAGLSDDTEALREKYFSLILERFEKHLGEAVRPHVIFNRSYAYSNFVNDYNSFKGNAYGLANTLLQTSIFRPSCRSKKVANLFYAGQLTVPGPGVPPSLISGEVVANEVMRMDAS
jgi:phytoene desaturase